MATIHFYEKPGCINNGKQKQLLIAAGHQLIVHDLLTEPWAARRDQLRWFFGDLPVCDWINRAAPAVKSGAVTPELLSESMAIELMIADPLLIRRPLLEADGQRAAGFDAERIDAWLGLNTRASDLETCPKSQPREACQP